MKFYCFACLLCLLMLSGCAAPIPAEEMLANPNIYTQINKSALTKSVAVDKVTLSTSMPSTGLVVTPSEFSRALEISLNKAGWYSNKNSEKYNLSAYFVGFDQPFTLFNTKIFSEIKYELANKKTGSLVYQQTVKIPCVIGMGEVFNADMRQIETLKCSIRENVTHMMRDLNSKF